MGNCAAALGAGRRRTPLVFDEQLSAIMHDFNLTAADIRQLHDVYDGLLAKQRARQQRHRRRSSETGSSNNNNNNHNNMEDDDNNNNNNNNNSNSNSNNNSNNDDDSNSSNDSNSRPLSLETIRRHLMGNHVFGEALLLRLHEALILVEQQQQERRRENDELSMTPNPREASAVLPPRELGLASSGGGGVAGQAAGHALMYQGSKNQRLQQRRGSRHSSFTSRNQGSALSSRARALNAGRRSRSKSMSRRSREEQMAIVQQEQLQAQAKHSYVLRQLAAYDDQMKDAAPGAVNRTDDDSATRSHASAASPRHQTNAPNRRRSDIVIAVHDDMDSGSGRASSLGGGKDEQRSARSLPMHVEEPLSAQAQQQKKNKKRKAYASAPGSEKGALSLPSVPRGLLVDTEEQRHRHLSPRRAGNLDQSPSEQHDRAIGVALAAAGLVKSPSHRHVISSKRNSSHSGLAHWGRRRHSSHNETQRRADLELKDDDRSSSKIAVSLDTGKRSSGERSLVHRNSGSRLSVSGTVPYRLNYDQRAMSPVPLTLGVFASGTAVGMAFGGGGGVGGVSAGSSVAPHRQPTMATLATHQMLSSIKVDFVQFTHLIVLLSVMDIEQMCVLLYTSFVPAGAHAMEPSMTLPLIVSLALSSVCDVLNATANKSKSVKSKLSKSKSCSRSGSSPNQDDGSGDIPMRQFAPGGRRAGSSGSNHSGSSVCNKSDPGTISLLNVYSCINSMYTDIVSLRRNRGSGSSSQAAALAATTTSGDNSSPNLTDRRSRASTTVVGTPATTVMTLAPTRQHSSALSDIDQNSAPNLAQLQLLSACVYEILCVLLNGTKQATAPKTPSHQCQQQQQSRQEPRLPHQPDQPPPQVLASDESDAAAMSELEQLEKRVLEGIKGIDPPTLDPRLIDDLLRMHDSGVTMDEVEMDDFAMFWRDYRQLFGPLMAMQQSVRNKTLNDAKWASSQMSTDEHVYLKITATVKRRPILPVSSYRSGLSGRSSRSSQRRSAMMRRRRLAQQQQFQAQLQYNLAHAM
eukprot:TRINITY_DN66324_c4_g9_i1.p1 TRINITY_DN66324_c4_g9~~TRINITY_DN66324_c4_g9_i1.p1  ORF type:complete len:1028 (-),score=530.12 TRINITY_DN66324_c4_g9_i1:131-3214(-)